jgi:hypothetical protein
MVPFALGGWEVQMQIGENSPVTESPTVVRRCDGAVKGSWRRPSACLRGGGRGTAELQVEGEGKVQGPTAATIGGLADYIGILLVLVCCWASPCYY